MDHGGGTLEAMAKLVAEVLCVPLEKVGIAPAETCSTVYDVTTHATRGVYAGCGAAVRVALKVLDELKQHAATFLNVMPEAVEIYLDEKTQESVLWVPSIPDKKITIREIAHRLWTQSVKTIAAVDSYRPVNCPPAYVCVFVEVEVDTWTGNVRLARTVTSGDAGTVINPDAAAGQLEGGISRGSGFAIYESNTWNEDGQLSSKGYWIDAKTPGIMESPRLDQLQVFFADTIEPSGPLGAKGLGEAASNPVAAAFANAIYNATGLRFHELPITPEKLLTRIMENEPVLAKELKEVAR